MALQMKVLIALSVGAYVLLWSGNIPLYKPTSAATSTTTSFVSTAEARVARGVGFGARRRNGNRDAPVNRAGRY